MTWYYMPSTSAADTADSSSPCDTLESTPEPWLTLSGTATQRPLSWHGWGNRAWIKLLSGLTCSPSTLQRGADEWISSLPVSPASHSAPPASGWALTTTATSGPALQTSSATFDPATSCWKTSGELFEQCYPMSSLTLPDSGSMRNGECSPRPPLAHPIAANAGGAWPTPIAGDAKGNGNSAAALAKGWNGTLTDVAVRMWPTPVARDDQKSPEAHMAMKARMDRNTPTSLTVVAKMWPTPKAADTPHKNGAGDQARNSPSPPVAVAMWPTPRASEGFRGTDPPHGTGGPSLRQVATSGPHDPMTETAGTVGKVLNPRFIEALMGLPNGWLTIPRCPECNS